MTITAAAEGPAGMAGTGTAGDPYVITNVTQLQAMEQELDAHYVLGDDIDASETDSWNGGSGFDPIGSCPDSHSHPYNDCSGGDPFTGTFDGKSHSITNLTMNRPSGTGVGLFGLAEGAEFRNLRLESVNVTGEENVGGLVGHMQRDGSGYPSGSVENVSVSGDVTWSGTGSGSAGGKFGGIVGLAANAQMDNKNVFRGNVTGKFNVGGLVGRMAWKTTIGTSYAQGTVTSTAAVDSECGLGNEKCEAGGIAGNSGNPSTINEVYAAVTVTAPTAGAIIGDDNHGSGEDTLTNVYWDADVGPSDASGGPIDEGASSYAGLSTAEMQGSTAEEHMNFDWDGTWQTVPGDYPVFQWEAAALDPISVTGTITDALDGATIEGATVESTIDSTTTDANGKYTLEVSALGDSVNATATVGEGFTITNETIVANPESSNTVDLALGPEYNGSGTEANPYQVATLEDLQQMRYNLSAHYVLVNDVDASATAGWNGDSGFDPVGNTSNQFAGTLDGDGYEVSNLTIDRSGTNNVGLIGYLDSGGALSNVTVSDANITGHSGVGALVGSNSGNVTRAVATGTVTGYSAVGGLVGAHTEGTVNRSTTNATVTGDYNNVGGLVGHSDATILESAASGSATSNGGDRVGGLVGTNRGTIRRSYATASAKGVERVGGLVGMNWATHATPGEIHDSYATGSVSASADGGGIVGFTFNGASTSDSYWDRLTTGQTTTAESGTDLATADVTGTAASGNMTAFDFGSTWLTTDSYPILRWQLSTLSVRLDASTITTTNSTNAKVTLTLQDGSTRTATEQSGYSSNDTSVATITSTGHVDGTGVGSASITASHGGTSDSDSLVVIIDTAAPTADAGSNQTVNEGARVTFNGSASTDNVGIVAYNWSFGDGTNATGLNTTHTYPDPGTYTVVLNVSDAAGNHADDTLALTVRAVSSSGSGGSGGGGGTSGQRITVEPLAPSDDSEETATQGSRVTIENAQANTRISIDVNGEESTAVNGDDPDGTAEDRNTDNAGSPTDESSQSSLRDNNVVMDQIEMTVNRGGSYDLEVQTQEVDLPSITDEPNDDSGGTTADLSTDALSETDRQFVSETGSRPSGYVQVDHAFPDSDVSDVTLQFRVRKSYLSAIGVEPGAVQLYRDEPTGWRALSTQQVGETDEYYRFAAGSPGLSLFTIGTASPVFEIEETSIASSGSSLRVGDPVTVMVTVRNVGGANGQFAGLLTARGDHLDEETMSIPMGERRTTELGGVLQQAGWTDLTLNGRTLGSIEVVESGMSETEGQGSEPSVAEPDSSGEEGSWSIVLVVIGVVVLVGVAVFARRQLGG